MQNLCGYHLYCPLRVQEKARILRCGLVLGAYSSDLNHSFTGSADASRRDLYMSIGVSDIGKQFFHIFRQRSFETKLLSRYRVDKRKPVCVKRLPGYVPGSTFFFVSLDAAKISVKLSVQKRIPVVIEMISCNGVTDRSHVYSDLMSPAGFEGEFR